MGLHPMYDAGVRLAVLILALLLTACGQAGGPRLPPDSSPVAPEAVPSPQPTELPADAAPTPAPPTVDALMGGTLGATRMAWVGVRGNPVPGGVLTGAERFPGNIDVLFGPTPSGQRAFHVEVYLGRDLPVSEARALAAMLHPPDGRPVGTYMDTAGQTVEMFQSARLAQAFEGAELPLRLGPYFGDEPPGTYIQIAERGRPTTSIVLLAVGNNP